MSSVITKKTRVLPGYIFTGNPAKKISLNKIGIKKEYFKKDIKKELSRFNLLIKKILFIDNNMIKFFDIYKQDKNIHVQFLKELKIHFKKTDFILGNSVKNFEKIFQNFQKVNFQLVVQMEQMRCISH